VFPRSAGSGATALVVLLVISFARVPALAIQPDEVLPDPALEQRARNISGGLRCLVCQNQSIDDSDAPLAKDLRILVRDRLKAGDSDAAVKDFIVQRYGEFVLLRPVFAPHTLLLWLTPLLVLVLGGTGIYVALRRRRTGATPGLNAEEQEALDAVLRNDRAS
jgi:cytochrome c-type biogenesis protein CcmH